MIQVIIIFGAGTDDFSYSLVAKMIGDAHWMPKQLSKGSERANEPQSTDCLLLASTVSEIK